MTTENINIVIKERGARQVRRNINDIGSGANRAARNLLNFRNVMGLVFGGGALIAVTRFADTFTQVQNRLKTVTETTRELNAVTNELFEIARRTRSQFEGTAETYTRTALATREMGLGAKETLKFTESLNQAIILSGATTQEAEAGLVQFTQGLASGALRGDELRSVLEQLPVVADVIAQRLGVTRGALRDLAKDGTITSQVIVEAFQDARVELAERFGETIPTIGQAFVNLRTSIIQTFGEFDQAIGGTNAIAQAVIFLSDSIDTLSRVAAAFITVATIGFGVRVVRSISLATKEAIALEKALLRMQITSGVASAAQAGQFSNLSAVMSQLTKLAGNLLTSLRGILTVLTFGLAASNLGLLATGFIALGVGAAIFADKILLGTDNITTLRDLFRALGEQIVDGFRKMAQGLADFLGPLPQGFRDAGAVIGEVFERIGLQFDFSMVGMLKFAASILDSLLGLFKGAFAAIGVVIGETADIFKRVWFVAINTVIGKYEDFLNFFINSLNRLSSIIGDGLNLSLIEFDSVGDPGPDVENLGVRVNQAFAAGFKSSNFFSDALAQAIARAEQIALERANQKVGLDDSTGNGGLTPGQILAQAEAIFEMTQAFDEFLDILRIEGELARLSRLEREQGIAILEAEERARKALGDELLVAINGGQELTALQAEELAARGLMIEQVEGQEAAVVRLTGAMQDHIATMIRNNEVSRIYGDILDANKGLLEDFLLTQEAVNQALASGLLNSAQAKAALNSTDLGQEVLKAQEDLFGNFALGRDAQISQLQIFQEDTLTIIQQGLEARLLTETEAAALRLQLEADTEDQRRLIIRAGNQEIRDNIESTFGSLADVIGAFAGKQSTAFKVAFAASQAFALANAVVQTASAVTTALASAPPPANFFAAAAVGAAGAAEIAAIISTAIGLKDGGLVSGPGGSRGDMIPARLSDGEFVVNAAATRKNMELLKDINAGAEFQSPRVRGFQNGGMATQVAGRSSGSQRIPLINTGGQNNIAQAPAVVPAPEVNIQVINQTDPNDTIAVLGSKAGEQQVINIIQNNPRLLKRLVDSV